MVDSCLTPKKSNGKIDWLKLKELQESYQAKFKELTTAQAVRTYIEAKINPRLTQNHDAAGSVLESGNLAKLNA